MRLRTATPLPLCFAAWLGVVLLAGSGSGCGGVTSAQVVARDRATTASCDWYQMCGQIGPDATQKYADRGHCEVDVRAFWDADWPPAQCDSKINQAKLTLCLDAIHATVCADPGMFFVTVALQCSEVNVCSGP